VCTSPQGGNGGNACDQKSTSEWAVPAVGASLVVNFGSPVYVASFNLRTQGASNDDAQVAHWGATVSLDYSVDGSNWLPFFGGNIAQYPQLNTFAQLCTVGCPDGQEMLNGSCTAKCSDGYYRNDLGVCKIGSCSYVDYVAVVKGTVIPSDWSGRSLDNGSLYIGTVLAECLARLNIGAVSIGVAAPSGTSGCRDVTYDVDYNCSDGLSRGQCGHCSAYDGGVHIDDWGVHYCRQSCRVVASSGFWAADENMWRISVPSFLVRSWSKKSIEYGVKRCLSVSQNVTGSSSSVRSVFEQCLLWYFHDFGYDLDTRFGGLLGAGYGRRLCSAGAC